MLLKIFLLIILILINGVFSATEIAFLSIDKYELNKKLKLKDKKAIKITHLLNDSSSFLSAIQIAITLSGFLASAFAAEGFASEIANIIHITFITKTALTNILIVLITIILSYFTLVFGELVPKKIGLGYANEISFAMVDIINLIIKIFKPFIIILKLSTDKITTILHIKKKEKSSEEDLKNTIVDSSLEELEKQLLLNIFEFNDITTKEVMTPKSDVISIDIKDDKKEIINKIKKYKYTKFPVMNKEKVIGILNIKDLIINHSDDFKLNNYLRKVYTIDSNMIIDDAYLFLISNGIDNAIVVENNKYIGIITIEDILESIIGNINTN